MNGQSLDSLMTTTKKAKHASAAKKEGKKKLKHVYNQPSLM